MTHHAPHEILPILIASLAVILAGVLIAQYFGRKAKTTADWLVAGRSLPLFVVVITQFATAVGGGVLVAHVSIAYSSGWSVFAYEVFSLLGFWGLALIGRWLRENDFATLPDILRRFFGNSRPVTVLGGLCALVVPLGWLATQFVAFAELFTNITGLPVNALMLFMAIATLLFVIPGGLMSVAWTDFIFGLAKIVMALIVAFYALHLAGGWHGITAHVPRRLWQPSGIWAAGTSTITLWLFAVLPGSLTNQMYYQRLFATRDVKFARRGLVLSGLTILIAGVYAGLIGLSVRAMHPGLGPADAQQAAGWLLTRLPTALLTVFGAFLVVTIVSTSGSSLQSVVASLVNDIYLGARTARRSDRRLVMLSKALTVVVTAVALVLAIVFPQALGWLVATYAYSAASLAVPIFGGYFLHRRRHLTPTAGFGAMVCGLAGCAAAQLFGTAVPYVVFGLAASLAWLLAATLLTGFRERQGPDGQMKVAAASVTREEM